MIRLSCALVAVLVLATGFVRGQQLAQPQPSPAKTESKDSGKQTGASSNPQAPPQPTTTATVVPGNSKPAAPQPQGEADQLLNKLSEPMLWATLALAVIAFFQYRISKRQASIGQSQADIAALQNKIIEGQTTYIKAQAGHMEEGLKLTREAATAATDGAKAASDSVAELKKQKQVLERQTQILSEANWNAQRIERAYLSVSPFPEGLMIETAIVTEGATGVPQQAATLAWKITNQGRTPATITATSCGYYMTDGYDGPVPEKIKYHPAKLLRTHQVGGSWFRLRMEFTMPQEDVDELHKKLRRLIFYGYVDYIDEWQERRRTGFARKVRPGYTLGKDEHGTTYYTHALDFELSEALSFDVLRLSREGDDWPKAHEEHRANESQSNTDQASSQTQKRGG